MSIQTKKYPQLKYRIVYCSSEDEDHPVTELLKQGSHCKGWESARFCEYPQIVIVQFMGVVVLKQLQFLSHQAKISSKLELYSFCPQSNMDLPGPETLPKLKFKRLGYLSLDSNERSSYTARELKSVYVDSKSFYLKIGFHKCHVNKFNIFKQVGLIALNCLGETPDNTEQKQGFGQIMEDFTNFDPVTLEKLKMLNHAKDQAVDAEDFDEAKRLKDAIDRLKAVSKNLNLLEQKKRISIQNEDYESAKIIKIEIDRLRNAALGTAPMMQPGFIPQPQFQKPQQPMYPAEQYMPLKNAMVMEERNLDMITGAENLIPFPEDQRPTQEGFSKPQSKNVEKELPIKSSPKKLAFIPAAGGMEENPVGEMNVMKKKFENEFELKDRPQDEQVIPTLLGKGKKPLDEEYEPPTEHVTKAEPLSAAAKKLADPYSSVLELDLLKMLFSKSWNLREEALDILQNEVSSKSYSNILLDNRERILTNLLGICGHLVNDKISQVSLKAMALVDLLMGTYDEEVKHETTSFSNNVDALLGILLEKIGEGNQKIRSHAECTILNMSAHQSVGPFPPSLLAVKSKNDKKGKPLSAKHISGRLNILADIIRDYGADKKTVPLTQIIDYGIKGIQNSNNEIRNAAYALIAEIYRCIGNGVRPYLNELRPAQLEVLEAEFEKVDGVPGAGGKKKKKNEEEEKGPKTFVSTNIHVAGQKKTAAKPVLKKKNVAPIDEPIHPQKHGAPDEFEVDNPEDENDDENWSYKNKDATKTCEYCGKFDPSFDEDALDLHMWKECPMLCFCPSCGNVIEIFNLNNHLLNECVDNGNFRQCPICKEAIHVQDYEAHLDEKSCQKALPEQVAIRCPLCHMDVKPSTIEGWRDHILVRQCPNNERRPI